MNPVTQVTLPLERLPKIFKVIETGKYGNGGPKGYANRCKLTEGEMNFLIQLTNDGDFNINISASDLTMTTLTRKNTEVPKPSEATIEVGKRREDPEIDLSHLLSRGLKAMKAFHEYLETFKSAKFPGFQWQTTSPNLSSKSFSAVTIRPNCDGVIDIFGGKVFEINLSPSDCPIQSSIVITPRLLLMDQVMINFEIFALDYNSSIALRDCQELRTPIQTILPGSNNPSIDELIDTFNSIAFSMVNRQLDFILSKEGVLNTPKILTDRQKELHHNLVEVLVKTLSLEITERPTDKVKAKLELLQSLVNPTIYPFYNQSTGLRALIKNLVTKNA